MASRAAASWPHQYCLLVIDHARGRLTLRQGRWGVAPVYLVHGADDNVIPAVESTRLAEYLRGRTRVRQLVTPFLTHVDVADRPGVNDTWEMIDFWKAILAER